MMNDSFFHEFAIASQHDWALKEAAELGSQSKDCPVFRNGFTVAHFRGSWFLIRRGQHVPQQGYQSLS